MARRKSRKGKNIFLTFIVIIVLIGLGVLIGNSIMNGELLKNFKISEEKKQEEKQQASTKSDIEQEDPKEEKEVFTKKEDETSFKLVDKTVDDTKPSTKPTTTETIKTEKERENLAISVVKKEWYGGEEPESTDVYFSISRKKSESVYTVEVRDKATTRLKSRYDVNIAKKEIVNVF